MADERRLPPTRAERFKNYCIGLGALTALILGTVNMLWDRSKAVEKKADNGYEKLAKKVNELASFSSKVQLKLAILQAKEEERTAMKVFHKLEASEAANEKLQEQLEAIAKGTKVAAVKKPTKPRVKVAKVPVRCNAGHVQDATGRCRRVPQSVATRVFVDDMKKQASKIQLDLERERRKKAEREKRAMGKTVQAVQNTYIKKVPLKLDDLQHSTK
jgi:hypothetical protein